MAWLASSNSPGSRRPFLRIFLFLLKLGIACGLIGWLFASNRLNLGFVAGHIVSLVAALCILSLIANLILCALRWLWLLRLQGIGLPFRATLRWSWIGEFFTLFTPGGNGSEIVRIYFVLRHLPGSRLAAVSTIIADRVLGLLALLLLGSVSAVFLLIQPGSHSTSIESLLAVTLFSFGLGALGIAALSIPTLRQWSARLMPSAIRPVVQRILDIYAGGNPVFFRCIVLSLVADVFLMVPFLLAGKVLGSPPSWQAVFLVVPAVFITQALPISIGGLGVGEAVASLLFAEFGCTEGAAIMLLVRAWSVLVQAVGSVFYLTGGGRIPLNALKAAGDDQ